MQGYFKQFFVLIIRIGIRIRIVNQGKQKNSKGKKNTNMQGLACQCLFGEKLSIVILTSREARLLCDCMEHWTGQDAGQ